MKKLFFTLAITFAATIAFAQTARIAHRSHSGSGKKFSIAAGNFGLSPEQQKAWAKKQKEDTARLRTDTIIRVGIDTLRKDLPVLPKQKPLKKKKAKKVTT